MFILRLLVGGIRGTFQPPHGGGDPRGNMAKGHIRETAVRSTGEDSADLTRRLLAIHSPVVFHPEREPFAENLPVMRG
jgi:hypothetical protein